MYPRWITPDTTMATGAAPKEVRGGLRRAPWFDDDPRGVIPHPPSRGVCVYTDARGEAGDGRVRRGGGEDRLGGSRFAVLPALQASRGVPAGGLHRLYHDDDRRRPVLQPLRDAQRRGTGHLRARGGVLRDHALQPRPGCRRVPRLALQELRGLLLVLQGAAPGRLGPEAPDAGRPAGVLRRAAPRAALALRELRRGAFEDAHGRDVRVPRQRLVLAGPLERAARNLRDGRTEDGVGGVSHPRGRGAATDFLVDGEPPRPPSAPPRRAAQAPLRQALHRRLRARPQAPLRLPRRPLAHHRPRRQALGRRARLRGRQAHPGRPRPTLPRQVAPRPNRYNFR